MTSEQTDVSSKPAKPETEEVRLIRSKALTQAQIDSLDGAVVLDPEDLDEAIIGVSVDDQNRPVAVYSYERLIDVHAKDMEPYGDQTAEEVAMEWVDYNTLRAVPYMGERAPIIVTDDEETGAEPDPEDDEAKYLEIGGKKYRVIS